MAAREMTLRPISVLGQIGMGNRSQPMDPVGVGIEIAALRAGRYIRSVRRFAKGRNGRQTVELTARNGSRCRFRVRSGPDGIPRIEGCVPDEDFPACRSAVRFLIRNAFDAVGEMEGERNGRRESD